MVALSGPSSVTTTARDGTFAAEAPPGEYRLTVSANGFAAVVVESVAIVEGSRIDVSLDALDSTTPREIGHVRVDGRLVVARGQVPRTTIDREDLERLGQTNVLDALEEVPSVTVARPDGGASSAVAVVSLRGPDPSETLVTMDGQVLNDTNTGDFDFAQVPIAPFSRVEVSEGLGPDDHLWANTIGGDIDMRSLAPTLEPQRRGQLSYGSFGTAQFAADATGALGKLGYAFSGTSATQQGYVHGYPAQFASSDPGAPNAVVDIGSGTRAQTALANLIYSPSDRTSFRVRYFTLADTRDISAALDAPSDEATQDHPNGLFAGPGSATFTKGLRALLVSARAPLGAGEISASYASSGQTTTYDAGTPVSPYDLFSNDGLQTVSFEYAREGGTYSYAAGGYTRGETLDEGIVFNGDVQNERSIAFSARGAVDIGPAFHLSASAFQTHYSTFGSNLDGRIGFDADVDRHGVLRASVGTGLRAPLLAEKYTLSPEALNAGLPGDVDDNCVAANGDPNERPEHVTAYELGYGRSLDARTTADVSVYRTNLRDPVENAYPLGASCPAAGPPVVAGQVIPVNVGNVIYEGAALRFVRLGRTVDTRLAYGLNVAYPFALPATVSNPTSGGNLIDNEQFQSIPIQTGSFSLGWHGDTGRHADLETIYRGRNNELNDGQFAVVNLAFGVTRGGFDATFAVHNLTGAESGRFTRLGLGLPYGSPVSPGGVVPTDRVSLEPGSASIVLTFR